MKIATLQTGGPARAIAFSPDGRYLAAGVNTSASYDVLLWRTLNWGLAHRLQPQDQARSLAFANDGSNDLVVGTCFRELVQVWDTQIGKKLRVFKGHRQEVLSVAVNPATTQIVSFSFDMLFVRDYRSGKRLFSLEADVLASSGTVAYSPNKDWLAASIKKSIYVYDTNSWKVVHKIDLEGEGAYQTVAFSRDGTLLSAGGAPINPYIYTWDTQSWREVSRCRARKHSANSLAFGADRRRLASGSADDGVHLWDVVSGNEVGEGDGSCLAVAFHPRRPIIASGNFEDTVCIWQENDAYR